MRFTTVTQCLLPILTAACVQSVAIERAVVAGDLLDESQAIAKIVRLGGRVEPDAASPERTVTAVQLSFSGVGNNDLHVLRAFKNLKKLALTSTGVTDDGLKELRDLKNLASLELHFNQRITGVGLRHLGELKRLTSLDVSHSPIADAGCAAIGELKTLAVLNMAETGIAGDCMKQLKGLGKLCWTSGSITSRMPT